MFTIATAEFLMRAAFYEENDGSSIALRASTWGLGQIMTVITMASFIWEIANFHSKRNQVLDNFSVQWMRCGCFHFGHTLLDTESEGGNWNLAARHELSYFHGCSRQSDDRRANVDMTNANSETDPVAAMTHEQQLEIHERSRTFGSMR